MIRNRRMPFLVLIFGLALVLLLLSPSCVAAPARPRPGGALESKLSKLGVDDATQRAIAGMAKAGISHNKIVDNMRSHFPNHRDHELNDIVVASNIAQQSRQARGAAQKQKKRL
jgi:hypothetical protein